MKGGSGSWLSGELLRPISTWTYIPSRMRLAVLR
jgi:hypothetical protein